MRIGHILADRFVIESLAGRGGMGEVYRALDQSTGQAVAVKVMRESKEGQVARLQREARILAELDHPRIVGHVAHGLLASGEPYLAMEWLQGEDLAARLSRGRLGMRDSLELTLAVAEALGVLHERGIIHRDLKPSNVFLVNGRVDGVKLLDFGLARVEEGTRMTGTGAMLGTIAYMAPEQARGARALDGRVDIFALGCVLFECLTGAPAFSAGHATAILAKLLFDEAPRLGDRLPNAPAALEALLARMLSKQPDERPRDGRAAAEVLRALLATQVPETETAPAPEVGRPSALTDSEQRSVAVILIGAPVAAATPAQDAELGQQAAAHGGRFERLMDGSGAVLLSGTILATDLAAQAARCALAIRRHAAGPRIALAAGRSETAGRFLVGNTMERAARLLERAHEVAALPDEQRAYIRLDEAMAGLLDFRFYVREEGGVAVLHGERDLGEVRTLLGKPTPCVGRERELGLIEQLFEAGMEDSVAQAVLVTAAPGIGKSRLAQEFLGYIRSREQPAAIWMGRGDSLRAGSVFGLLGQALRDACGVRDGEPLELRRDKVRACVARQVAESQRQRVAEFVGELIGTPFPDDASLPLRAARKDAQLMNEQMRAAFLDFVAAACSAQAVVIVLEDLHWGDRSTVQFLDRALRELCERPLFVLALARPEVHEVFPKLWAERAMQEIRLRELDKKAIARLVRHVLGNEAGADTIERLARLSEGNAFYLEELIRATAEAKEGELPQTVVAMVQSRLGALDSESRRLLRAASVFGEVCWTGSVAALLGGGRHAAVARALLTQLVEREVLVRRKDSRFPGQEEYAFRHALLREGAYAMLTEEDRVLGHRLAGQWLEAHGEQDALMLAEHFEKGGDREQAGRYYLHAVEQAHWAIDSSAAHTHGQRALACGIAGVARLELLAVLCETLFYQGHLAATQPYADEIFRVARPGSSPWARTLLVRLAPAIQGGHIDEFLATIREFVEFAASPDLASSIGMAFSSTVHGLDLFGRIKEADAVVERLGTTVYQHKQEVSLGAYYWHAVVGTRAAHAEENPASGLWHRQTAIDIANAIGNRRYASFGPVMTGMHRWFLGRAEEAERDIQGVARAQDEEMGLNSSFRSFVLSWLLADRGALDEARQWAARLIAYGQARRIPLDEGRGHWALGEVLRRAGELAAAEAESQRALALLEAKCPLDVPGVMATLAAVRLAQGQVAAALSAAEEGMAQHDTMGACSMFFRGAFLRLVHAQCLAAAGRHEAATAAITRARARLFAIAEKVGDEYCESFLDNVPENRRTLELAKEWLGEG